MPSVMAAAALVLSVAMIQLDRATGTELLDRLSCAAALRQGPMREPPADVG